MPYKQPTVKHNIIYVIILDLLNLSVMKISAFPK